MAVLLAVWVSVFWLYKPSTSAAGGASGSISFGQPPDLAKALVSTDPVQGSSSGVFKPVAPLPVAPLPGQEPPFVPAPTPPQIKRLVPPEFTDYTVQKGDNSFAAISKRVYGTTQHAEAVSRANPWVTPSKLIAGRTKLRIPKDPTNIQGRVEGPDGTDASDTATADGRSGHIVQPGETLGAISKRYYGTTTRWKDILAANADQLEKPEKLRPGMTLIIPPKD